MPVLREEVLMVVVGSERERECAHLEKLCEAEQMEPRRLEEGARGNEGERGRREMQGDVVLGAERKRKAE